MQFSSDPLINAIYQGIKRDIQVAYDNECYRACLILIYCESLLISFRKDEDGKTIPGHFSTKGAIAKEYEDIRQSFGSILCEYQKLIDNILDHFDVKFMDWYGFKPSRPSTISAEGYAGIMLWWAYKYGNYRNNGIVVVEDN